MGLKIQPLDLKIQPLD